MRIRIAIPIVVVSSLVASAGLAGQPPPKPPAAICLDPKKDYDAEWLSGRAVIVKANVGKPPRAKVKAETNCIGIDGGADVSFEAKGACLAAGDTVKIQRRHDNGVQTCQVTQVTAAP